VTDCEHKDTYEISHTRGHYFDYCGACNKIKHPGHDANGGHILLAPYWITREEFEQMQAPYYGWRTRRGKFIVPRHR